MMLKKAWRYLLAGELSFFIFLAIQIWLRPAGWSANSGISYYSVIWPALVPYLLGLWVSAALIWLSAHYLPTNQTTGTIRAYLRFCAIWMIGLSLAPDISYTIFSRIHLVFGTALFLTEFYLSLLLARRSSSGSIWLLFSLLTAGGLLSFISLVNILPWSIQGQILFQLAFCLLIAQSFRQYLTGR